MRTNLATVMVVATVSVVGIASHADARPNQDMGTHHVIATHRMVPYRIEGTFASGFTVWLSDGNPRHNYSTSEGTWRQQLRECDHDPHPTMCVAMWGMERQYLADEKVMLRLAAQS